MSEDRRRRGTVALAYMPSVSELRTMTVEDRIEVMREVDEAIGQLRTTHGVLEALILEPPPPPPLLDAIETGRRLGMSDEWVRQHGRALDIEVYVSDGVYRYDPDRVEALRQRRRPESDQGEVLRLRRGRG